MGSQPHFLPASSTWQGTSDTPSHAYLPPPTLNYPRAKHGTSLNPNYVMCNPTVGQGGGAWSHAQDGGQKAPLGQDHRPGLASACSGLYSSSLTQHHGWPSRRPEPQAGRDPGQGESQGKRAERRREGGGRNTAPLCWLSMSLTLSLCHHLTQGRVSQCPVTSALSRAEVEGTAPLPGNSVGARSSLTSHPGARPRDLYLTCPSPSPLRWELKMLMVCTLTVFPFTPQDPER